MSYNYTLKYRRFDQLIDEIRVDFKNYTLENYIEPHEMIKVAKRVNYDLGLRIFKTKETLLEVEKGRVKLPDDFFVLNYALICDEVSITQGMPQGTWTEERPLITPYKMTSPFINTCCDTPPNCGCSSTPCSCSPQLSAGCNPCNQCGLSTSTTTTSTSVTVTTNNCCWTTIIKQTATGFTVVINGIIYNIPLVGGIPGILNYLNTLNLGVWTITISIAGVATMCVTGTATYGVSTITQDQTTTTLDPVCTSSTVTTVTNDSVETCKCSQPTCSTDSCTKPRVVLNCKNECYELVQIVNPGLTRTFKRLLPIRILENPQSVECGCPNLYMNCGATGWIRDGWFYTDFQCGKIYISYQGMLEDDDGNLLVPDHDMLNEYYEYALKQRILENLIMNDEPQAAAKLQLIETRYRAARNYALSIVNTPNFSEMKQVWAANRKAMYGRYYDMFKSYPWNTGGPGTSFNPTNFSSPTSRF